MLLHSWLFFNFLMNVRKSFLKSHTQFSVHQTVLTQYKSSSNIHNLTSMGWGVKLKGAAQFRTKNLGVHTNKNQDTNIGGGVIVLYDWYISSATCQTF